MRRTIAAVPISLFASLALLVAAAASAEPTAEPATVVAAFNQAISVGDAEAAKTQLAGGGVQFTLRSMHAGIGPDELTTPLTDHWSMILPVIFGSTERYSRAVDVLSAETIGDIATVWTKTTTNSLRRGQSEAQTNEFTELYFLVASGDGWKIASIADNRAGTSLTQE